MNPNWKNVTDSWPQQKKIQLNFVDLQPPNQSDYL
jgi:hypothetical protein